MSRSRYRIMIPLDGTQPLARVWRQVMRQMTDETLPALPHLVLRGDSAEASAVLKASNARGLHVQLILTGLTETQTLAMMAGPDQRGSA